MKTVAYLHNEILIAVKMKGLDLYLAAKCNAYFKFPRDIYDRQTLRELLRILEMILGCECTYTQ